MPPGVKGYQVLGVKCLSLAGLTVSPGWTMTNNPLFMAYRSASASMTMCQPRANNRSSIRNDNALRNHAAMCVGTVTP